MSNYVVVTVVAPQARADLVLPAQRVIGELIPDVVDACTNPSSRNAAARWAMGPLGSAPYPPTASLSSLNVVDGMMLYLRDMTSPVPAPPPAPGPPPALISATDTAAQAHPDLGTAIATDAMGRPLGLPPLRLPPTIRWGYEPEMLTVLLPTAGILLLAVYLFSTNASGGHALTGLFLSLLLVAAYFAGMWWIGLLGWLGQRQGLAFLQPIPPPPGLSRPDAGDSALQRYRDLGMTQINKMVEDFIFDFGRMLAGQQPDFDYVAPRVVSIMRETLAPSQRAGERIIPNFGGQADVSVDWEPAASHRPITATAIFDDVSVRITASGERLEMPRRRMRLTVRFNVPLTQIVDASIAPV